MKAYSSPVLLENDELFEGVYAASGGTAEGTVGPDNGGEGDDFVGESSDCWTIDWKSTQDDNGAGQHIFEVRLVHSKDVEHISGATTVTYTFNSPVAEASSESGFECTCSGNTVTVTRTLLADAYKSGDVVTYKIWVKANDPETTKFLTIQSAEYTCKHETNVQGKYD